MTNVSCRRALLAGAVALVGVAAAGMLPAAGARAQTPPGASGGVFSAPKPTLDVLPSGLRVLVVERRGSAKIVAIDLRVRAGTAYETPENNGAAHFLEHLVFKGTPTRAVGDVDAAVEGAGGELTASTSLDWAQFAATVPTSGFKRALEVIADVIQNPALRPSDLETERRVILDEAASADADPARVSVNALRAAAYPDHPYRLSLYGPTENIERLSQSDVRAFWRAHYSPLNMTLVVVGDVSRAEVVDAARALFAAPATATVPAAPPFDPAPATLADPLALKGIVRAAPITRDRNLVTVALGFPAPSVKDAADAVALDVLLRLLARGGGYGRLGDALVRGGQNAPALAVSASYLTQRAPGLLTLTAIGPRGSENALENALVAQIRRLREDGATPAEVDDARRSALGQTLFDEETFAGQANTLAFYDAIDTYEFAVNYPSRLAAVTPADIARVIGRYLTPTRYAVATVVPRPAAPAPPVAGPARQEVRR